MGEFKNYRQESRSNWGTSDKDGLTIEQISLGAQLRMADALDVIAKDKQKLEDDYKYMSERCHYWRLEYEKLRDMYRAQKGLVTKLRKKLNAKEVPGE